MTSQCLFQNVLLNASKDYGFIIFDLMFWVLVFIFLHVYMFYASNELKWK